MPQFLVSSRTFTETYLSLDGRNDPVLMRNRNTTVLDLEGYVAVDTVREEIVVAFRGSSSTRNWIADFDFILTPTDACDGCYVHNGFYLSWEEIKTYATEYIEAAYALYPDYKLTLTGHSLGAAVATLAAVDLRTAG